MSADQPTRARASQPPVLARRLLLAGVSMVAIVVVLNIIHALPRERIVRALTEPVGGKTTTVDTAVADKGPDKPADQTPGTNAPAPQTDATKPDATKPDEPDMPMPRLSGGSQSQTPGEPDALARQAAEKTGAAETTKPGDVPEVDAPPPGLTAVIGTPAPPKVKEQEVTSVPAPEAREQDEAVPPPATDAPFSSTAGTVVADGIAPPQLRFDSFDANRVTALVRTGKAVIVARHDGRDVYYLDPADRFRPANDLDPTRLGQRFLVLREHAGLTTPWDLQLAGLDSSRRFTFALRFAAAFDAALLAAQNAALAERNIDVEALRRERRAIITMVRLDDRLQPVIAEVIIDPGVRAAGATSGDCSGTAACPQSVDRENRGPQP